jgi:hypothetical protein
MCGARWCISPSKKNSFDYFPYFFVVLHGHKSEGETKKKRKIFYWKMEGASDFVFCWAIESREAQRVHTHTHTHTYAHSISLVMLLPSLSLYKLRISCGRTKAKRHQIFFFLFPFFYTRPVNNPFTILFRLSLSLSDLSSIYAGIAVCVCVCLLVPFIIPSPGRFFVVIDGFFIFFSPQSLCVAFGPVYLPYNNKAPLCFHLRTWQLKFHFFLFLISPFLPLFEADTISPSNAFSRQKRSRPRCDAAGSHSRVLY